MEPLIWGNLYRAVIQAWRARRKAGFDREDSEHRGQVQAARVQGGVNEATEYEDCSWKRASRNSTASPQPQRVYAAIWYVLGAQASSHKTTLGPKYVPYRYMYILGVRNLTDKRRHDKQHSYIMRRHPIAILADMHLGWG